MTWPDAYQAFCICPPPRTGSSMKKPLSALPKDLDLRTDCSRRCPGRDSAVPATFPLRDAGNASAAGTTKRLLTTCQCDAGAARSIAAAGAVLRTGLQAEPCANVSARQHHHGWSLAGRLRDRSARQARDLTKLVGGHVVVAVVRDTGELALGRDDDRRRVGADGRSGDRAAQQAGRSIDLEHLQADVPPSSGMGSCDAIVSFERRQPELLKFLGLQRSTHAGPLRHARHETLDPGVAGDVEAHARGP
ncbi:hypothetical protein SAMN05216567_11136 [Variovorax sp. OK605]|nr:hypothetical protein SAMN05216567_11136 [Variovorax sp. OK605]